MATKDDTGKKMKRKNVKRRKMNKAEFVIERL